MNKLPFETCEALFQTATALREYAKSAKSKKFNHALELAAASYERQASEENQCPGVLK